MGYDREHKDEKVIMYFSSRGIKISGPQNIIFLLARKNERNNGKTVFRMWYLQRDYMDKRQSPRGIFCFKTLFQGLLLPNVLHAVLMKTPFEWNDLHIKVNTVFENDTQYQTTGNNQSYIRGWK